MTRRVCVVTGSRAEYGLLRGLLLRIRAEPGLALQLAVTGSHLAAEYGRTEQEIGADGFRIDRVIDILPWQHIIVLRPGE
jgi:UDP-N-acetylglucosamine 2-epimerase